MAAVYIDDETYENIMKQHEDVSEFVNGLLGQFISLNKKPDGDIIKMYTMHGNGD
ncbi:MAG: hypothetical protein QXZ44_03210 [Ferroplasma sp.]